jgi:hypothetical protein
MKITCENLSLGPLVGEAIRKWIATLTHNNGNKKINPSQHRQFLAPTSLQFTTTLFILFS